MAKVLGPIANLTKDIQDPKERATLKGVEIAKIGSIERTKVGDTELEVVSMNAIIGGVEVFARAWGEKGQIGFGKDGTVDIERFRILNPPILVPDGTKEVVIDRNNKEYEVDNFKEDSKEALLQSLAHTISVKKERFASDRIQPLKVGNTTSTFYPSLDGYISNYIAATGSWATLRGGGGTLTADYTSATSGSNTEMNRDGAGNTWWLLARSYYLFDTSGIPDSDTISSATLSLYIINVNFDFPGNSFNNGTNIGLVNPASDSALATTDWGNVTFTKQSDTETATGSMSTSAYNSWPLNATGISNVSKTGLSKFGVFYKGDFDDSEPAYAGSGVRSDAYNTYFSEQTGTSNDPMLVVEHGASTAIKTVDGLAKASVKTVNGLAIASVKSINGLQ